MLQNLFFLLLVLAVTTWHTDSFRTIQSKVMSNSVRSSMRRYALEPSVVQQLDEMQTRYERLSNNASPEADNEVAKMAPIVEKYKAYVEVNKLLAKLRMIYKNESSASRKEKQLKGFLELYRGKLEIEEYLKEKMGLPFSATPVTPKSVQELMKLDEELNAMKSKLSQFETKYPDSAKLLERRLSS